MDQLDHEGWKIKEIQFIGQTLIGLTNLVRLFAIYIRSQHFRIEVRGL